MNISAEVNGCAIMRGLRKTGLSREREMVQTPRPKPNNGDCCCHASSSLDVRAPPLVPARVPVVYRESAYVSNPGVNRRESSMAEGMGGDPCSPYTGRFFEKWAEKRCRSVGAGAWWGGVVRPPRAGDANG